MLDDFLLENLLVVYRSIVRVYSYRILNETLKFLAREFSVYMSYDILYLRLDYSLLIKFLNKRTER